MVLPEHDFAIGRYAFSGCTGLADENGYTIIRGVLYAYNSKCPEQFHVPEGVRQIISSVGQGLLNVHSVTLPASLEQIEDGLFKEVARLDRCVMAFPVTDPKEAQRIIKKVFDWETLAWAYLDGNVTACDLVLEALKKQIATKVVREELLEGLLEDENPSPLNRFLDCVKKLPLTELDEAIQNAKHTAVRAALLDYKQKTYTAKKVAKAKQDTQDKELGLKEKTLADWRKTLKIAKRGEHYAVTGIKESFAENAVFSRTAPDGVEIVIPAQIGGILVDIADRAFQNCPYIKTVTVEEGVTSIGDYAFSDCKRLRDVYLPCSVVEFGLNEGALFCAGEYEKPCTIHAPAGSKAEEQAKKNKLLFVAE